MSSVGGFKTRPRGRPPKGINGEQKVWNGWTGEYEEEEVEDEGVLPAKEQGRPRHRRGHSSDPLSSLQLSDFPVRTTEVLAPQKGGTTSVWAQVVGHESRASGCYLSVQPEGEEPSDLSLASLKRATYYDGTLDSICRSIAPRHKRPVGRAPKGKFWNEQTGEWDAKEELKAKKRGEEQEGPTTSAPAVPAPAASAAAPAAPAAPAPAASAPAPAEPAAPAPVAPAPVALDPWCQRKLEQFKEVHRQGLITDEDYAMLKHKVFDSMLDRGTL